MDEMGIPAKNIDGVELSPEQVKIAQERIPDANFRVGNLATIDLPQNHYDLVTRHMVDEHLDNETLAQVSKNTLGALKPEGVIVIVFTHPDKITASSGIKEEGKFETTFPWGAKGWNYFRPIDSYTKILEEAGFAIDSVQGWKISEEAKEENEQEYEKYKGYGNVRLAVVAHKPKASQR
jgi:trans-aconitate methyltransferase